MEVCEQNEAFVEEHGDLAFSHTKIILREGDQYYYAITSRRYPTTSEVDLLGKFRDVLAHTPMFLGYPGLPPSSPRH